MKRAVLLAFLFGAWACSSETTTYVSDAAPLGAFGDPCADPGDCESGVCVPGGVTGVCSEACTEGSCPAGFGCQMAGGQNVCIPDNPLLCASCADDSECAAAGDVCLTGVNGKSYCAQDCTSLGCPVGYECQAVDVGGAPARQCVPVSGACDCNAATSDAIEECSITHAFGTCTGSRRCQGAAGWGACEPPSATDLPDPSFADENCDGIDGDAGAAIFVARSGADDADCGLGHDTPCRSVRHALARAVEEGRASLYIQAGRYEAGEPIVLRSGVHLFGGYDTGWQRGPHTDPAHQVVLRGGADADSGALVTLEASSIDATTVVADLVIAGPSGTGGNGASSYAVFVEGSTGLALERVTIEGGDGAAGAAGADGTSASQAAAPGGSAGGDGAQLPLACNDSRRARGGGGGNHACSGTDTSGGDGGDSGRVDTDCPFDLDATPGQPGDGVPPPTAGGKGGEVCAAGGAGDPGAPGEDGAGGEGAPAGGSVAGSLYATSAGEAGSLGTHGGGGDGGGGAGGCDDGVIAVGGGGGGGGAGGCRAESAGGGGQGGGASFGLYAIDSEVLASGCAIERGAGGAGGRGGNGGSGQPGGSGGAGGAAAGNAQVGGSGQPGGTGGDSGGGGGGAGGDSVGIATRNSTVTHDCTITGGTAGDGGAGGSSSGNDGAPGASGRVLDQLAL